MIYWCRRRSRQRGARWPRASATWWVGWASQSARPLAGRWPLGWDTAALFWRALCWSRWAHLPRVKSHPRAELAAVCGRNRARAQELADKYDIPQVYTDYCEMIEVGDLDAVIISTPDDCTIR